MKSILFHISNLPYSSAVREEELETILFAASYDYQVTVLFSSQGVLQLNSLQNPTQGQKNFSKMIAAFPGFDITKVFVCAEDLAKYTLDLEILAVQVQVITKTEIGKLIQRFDIVMNY